MSKFNCLSKGMFGKRAFVLKPTLSSIVFGRTSERRVVMFKAMCISEGFGPRVYSAKLEVHSFIWLRC